MRTGMDDGPGWEIVIERCDKPETKVDPHLVTPPSFPSDPPLEVGKEGKALADNPPPKEAAQSSSGCGGSLGLGEPEAEEPLIVRTESDRVIRMGGRKVHVPPARPSSCAVPASLPSATPPESLARSPATTADQEASDPSEPGNLTVTSSRPEATGQGISPVELPFVPRSLPPPSLPSHPVVGGQAVELMQPALLREMESLHVPWVWVQALAHAGLTTMDDLAAFEEEDFPRGIPSLTRKKVLRRAKELREASPTPTQQGVEGPLPHTPPLSTVQPNTPPTSAHPTTSITPPHRTGTPPASPSNPPPGAVTGSESAVGVNGPGGRGRSRTPPLPSPSLAVGTRPKVQALLLSVGCTALESGCEVSELQELAAHRGLSPPLRPSTLSDMLAVAGVYSPVITLLGLERLAAAFPATIDILYLCTGRTPTPEEREAVEQELDLVLGRGWCRPEVPVKACVTWKGDKANVPLTLPPLPKHAVLTWRLAQAFQSEGIEITAASIATILVYRAGGWATWREGNPLTPQSQIFCVQEHEASFEWCRSLAGQEQDAPSDMGSTYSDGEDQLHAFANVLWQQRQYIKRLEMMIGVAEGGARVWNPGVTTPPRQSHYQRTTPQTPEPHPSFTKVKTNFPPPVWCFGRGREKGRGNQHIYHRRMLSVEEKDGTTWIRLSSLSGRASPSTSTPNPSNLECMDESPLSTLSHFCIYHDPSSRIASQ
eukprot:Sspe_Gene.21379::Locus_8008_Transcript_1_1_Confidence_1.000_Length_2192::g.21379::m.21379